MTEKYKIWKCKDGTRIAYHNLSPIHLIHILKEKEDCIPLFDPEYESLVKEFLKREVPSDHGLRLQLYCINELTEEQLKRKLTKLRKVGVDIDAERKLKGWKGKLTHSKVVVDGYINICKELKKFKEKENLTHSSSPSLSIQECRDNN